MNDYDLAKIAGVDCFCKDCGCWYHETEKVEEIHLPAPGAEPITRVAVALRRAQCRRYPPSAHYEGNGGWIRTEPDEWCGEFRP